MDNYPFKDRDLHHQAMDKSYIMRKYFGYRTKMGDVASLNENVKSELHTTLDKLLTPGKGILASDESPAFMKKQLMPFQLDHSIIYIKRFRKLLFENTSIEQYLSGVLLYPDTLFEVNEDGILHTDYLSKEGILLGIKLDKGKIRLVEKNQRVSGGLHKIHEECQKYKSRGFSFAKWRGAMEIQNDPPSVYAMNANACAMARFAVACQVNGLVPIVQADIRFKGNHDLEAARMVEETFYLALFKAFSDHDVYMESVILMLNVVTPGEDCQIKYEEKDIVKATIQTLQRTVPVAIPGIAFFTGGLAPDSALAYLNEIIRSPAVKPWKITFCYGRGLHYPVLLQWRGFPSLVNYAHVVFSRRLYEASQAAIGKWKPYVKVVKIVKEKPKRRVSPSS